MPLPIISKTSPASGSIFTFCFSSARISRRVKVAASEAASTELPDSPSSDASFPWRATTPAASSISSAWSKENGGGSSVFRSVPTQHGMRGTLLYQVLPDSNHTHFRDNPRVVVMANTHFAVLRAARIFSIHKSPGCKSSGSLDTKISISGKQSWRWVFKAPASVLSLK